MHEYLVAPVRHSVRYYIHPALQSSLDRSPGPSRQPQTPCHWSRGDSRRQKVQYDSLPNYQVQYAESSWTSVWGAFGDDGASAREVLSTKFSRPS